MDAWRSPGWPQTMDAFVIKQRALEVAQTGDIYTRDPPLRYVPLAILYRLTNASPDLLTHLYTTAMSYVALPLAIGAYFYQTQGRRVAILTVLGFAVWRLAGVGQIAYYSGWWHYAFTLPFVFVALAFVERTATSPSIDRRLQFALATGMALGFLGLNQYIMAATTILVTVLVFLRQNRIRELALTGTVGAAFSSVLVFAPAQTHSFIAGKANGPFNKEGVPWAIETVLWGLKDMATTPAYLFPLALIAVVLTGYRVIDIRFSEGGTTEVALLVTGISWFVLTALVNPRWASMIIQYILQYLLLGAVCQLAVGVGDTYRVPGWKTLDGVLFENQRSMVAVWSVVAVGLAMAFIVFLPRIAP